MLIRLIVFVGAVCVLSRVLLAQDSRDTSSRRYMTPEERRESGKKHEIFNGITLAGLLEFEYELERIDLTEHGKHSHSESSPLSIQGGLDLTPTDWLKGEIVYEYDFEEDDHVIDEALGIIESDGLSLEVGKLYLPLGEYFSNFSTGPVIEAAESRGLGGVLSYDFDDLFELSPFIFYGWSPEQSWIDDEPQWGIAMELASYESFSAGATYISHLGGSSIEVHDPEVGRSERDIQAVSSFIAVDLDPFSVTFEYVSALRDLPGFENNINRPRGWNIEVSRLLGPQLTLSMRLEGSEEFEDEPHNRVGLGVNFVLFKGGIFTLDLLRSDYKRGVAENTDGEEIDRSHAIVGQISVEL